MAAPVTFAPGVPLVVADAKRLITATYPKLFSRFNFAFHGHEDDEPLSDVIDTIASDVLRWLQAMPENFKTSSHALSRPKFGLLFVLKHSAVRERIGEACCNTAADTVELAWEECKRALVVVKDDPAQVLESEEELRGRVDDLVAKNEVLSEALVALINTHYDQSIASLFETLLKRFSA